MKLTVAKTNKQQKTPETELAAREIAQAVNAAMEALPDDLRQAVTLREIDGLSYEEIAEVMACPVAVGSRIFRAREAISARVRPHAGTPEWQTVVKDRDEYE